MDIKKITVGELETNCYLLISDQEMAVIDPGEDFSKIKNVLTAIGTNQPTVYLKYIILTHYHPDHTESAIALKKENGGKILIHEKEKNFIDFPADEFLQNDQIVTVGQDKLEVLLTPGHSAGSICLLGDGFIFSGDTLFASGYGRTDLAGGSEEKMANSLAVLRKIIKPGMTVYPGHGEIFLFGANNL